MTIEDWLGQLILWAGGLTAFLYLIKKGRDASVAGLRWLRVVGQLTSSEEWPNGSNSLPEATRNLYIRAQRIDDRTAHMELQITEMQRSLEILLLKVLGHSKEP